MLTDAGGKPAFSITAACKQLSACVYTWVFSVPDAFLMLLPILSPSVVIFLVSLLTFATF